MSALTEGSEAARTKMPLTLLVLSVFTIIANATLAARLVWEQTALTWRDGPQMVGFALVHGRWFPIVRSPVLIVGTVIWGMVEVMRAILGRRRPSSGVLASLAACVTIGALILTPYGFWQRVFVQRLTEGPYVGEFVTEAAALGDRRTLEAFLAHGAPVDVAGPYGTALHAAAVGNQPDMVEYLIARGASLNSINPYGDSPLENALSSNSHEAAQRLQAHGAQRIRGTKEHRDSVIAAEVDSAIAKMDRRDQEH